MTALKDATGITSISGRSVRIRNQVTSTRWRPIATIRRGKRCMPLPSWRSMTSSQAKSGRSRSNVTRREPDLCANRTNRIRDIYCAASCAKCGLRSGKRGPEQLRVEELRVQTPHCDCCGMSCANGWHQAKAAGGAICSGCFRRTRVGEATAFVIIVALFLAFVGWLAWLEQK
jgi:hypothetical protein